MKELREKEETAAADAEEVEALTHDLQKVSAHIILSTCDQSPLINGFV